LTRFAMAVILALGLGAACLAAAPSQKSGKLGAYPQVRAGYQDIVDGFARKDPDLATSAYDKAFKLDGLEGKKPFTWDYAKAVADIRSKFPGNKNGPSRMYFVRKVQPYDKGNKIAVVGLMALVDPTDGSDPNGGNSDGVMAFEDVWSKTASGKWQLVWEKQTWPDYQKANAEASAWNRADIVEPKPTK
jgi:hypothetical protein